MKKVIDLIGEILCWYILGNVGFIAVMEGFEYPVTALAIFIFCTSVVLKREGYVDKLLDKFKKS